MEGNREYNRQRNVNIIEDTDGKRVVVIHDIYFKGKRSVAWEDVKQYLKRYVGEFYEITDTKDIVYIGSDFPFTMKMGKLCDITCFMQDY